MAALGFRDKSLKGPEFIVGKHPKVILLSLSPHSRCAVCRKSEEEHGLEGHIFEHAIPCPSGTVGTHFAAASRRTCTN